MPLDPTLVRGLTPISAPQPDPNASMNQLGVIMKMQGLQNEMQANRLQAQKYQREANEAATLAAARRAYDPTNPDTGRALFGAGGAADLQSMASMEKSSVDAAKVKREETLSAFRNVVLPTLTPDNTEGIKQAYGALASHPLFNLFDGMPPEAVMKSVELAMSRPGGAEKVLNALYGLTPDKLAEMDVNRRNVDLRAGELGVSQRNAAVAEQNANTTEANARREAFDMLSQQSKPTQRSGVIGTNVSEETAAYHAQNIVDNANLIADALAKEPDAMQPGIMEATVANTYGLSGLKGATQSPQRQVIDQSNQQILDSVLYLATGAAYNKEQRLQQVESLIPKYFDRPEALGAQKQRVLSLLKGAKIRSSAAWSPELEASLNQAIDRMYSPTAAPSPRAVPAGGSGKPPLSQFNR